MIQPGDQLAGYRIGRRIGSGGMGDVFLAQHLVLGRLAAIKILRARSESRNRGGVARFIDEARAAAAIPHPAVVQILDCGVLPAGQAYIVMEHLSGLSLRDAFELQPPLRNDITLVAAMLSEIADGLGAAHAQSIIHRDVKPENLFLQHDARSEGMLIAKILDFGIAKLQRMSESGSLTESGAVLGTPLYMAPEQCRGERQIDGRADIYALGCVAFELLAGRRVFEADSLGALLIKQATETPPRLRDIAPAVPTRLAVLVDCMLAKQPADRPGSMPELAQELAGFLGCSREEVRQRLRAPSGFPPLVRSATTWTRPDKVLEQPAVVGKRMDVAGGASASGTGGSAQPLRTTRGPESSRDSARDGDAIARAAHSPSLASMVVSDRSSSHRLRSGGRGRLGWVVAAILAAMALFALVRPQPPVVQDWPPSGQGEMGHGVTDKVIDLQAPAPTLSRDAPPIQAKSAGAHAEWPAIDDTVEDDADAALSSAPQTNRVSPTEPLAKPQQIRIDLNSIPPGATVWLGDERTPRGTTPLELRIARRQGLLSVRLQRSGYLTRTLRLRPTRDQRIRTQLLPEAKGSPEGIPASQAAEPGVSTEPPAVISPSPRYRKVQADPTPLPQATPTPGDEPPVAEHGEVQQEAGDADRYRRVKVKD